MRGGVGRKVLEEGKARARQVGDLQVFQGFYLLLQFVYSLTPEAGRSMRYKGGSGREDKVGAIHFMPHNKEDTSGTADIGVNLFFYLINLFFLPTSQETPVGTDRVMKEEGRWAAQAHLLALDAAQVLQNEGPSFPAHDLQQHGLDGHHVVVVQAVRTAPRVRLCPPARVQFPALKPLLAPHF